MYSDFAERAYFTTDACAHCVTRDEHLRLERIAKAGRQAMERRRGSRIAA